MEKVKRHKDDGCRPAFLDGLAVADGPLYFSIQPEDQGRKWEALIRVAPDELLPIVEFYQRKGWRPDVLAPHWEGDRLYFMLVGVDNSDQVDWRFRMDMTLPQYHEESAAQKRDRLFPLAIASYGNDADVRYAAIWVRYRPEAGVP